ncbi:hypothetical protein KBC75_05595 [Candidatus Shapirobacteria bacterium]|nr:hypothetical protein [Candidatus Shapirobacteria bacterium]
MAKENRRLAVDFLNTKIAAKLLVVMVMCGHQGIHCWYYSNLITNNQETNKFQ